MTPKTCFEAKKIINIIMKKTYWAVRFYNYQIYARSIESNLQLNHLKSNQLGSNPLQSNHLQSATFAI